MVGEIGGDEEEKAAALHPGVDDEARARLHRRLHGAAREDDGPRGRDHLRLVRHRAGEEGGARGLRRHASARRRPRSRSSSPTSPAVLERIRADWRRGRARQSSSSASPVTYTWKTASGRRGLVRVRFDAEGDTLVFIVCEIGSADVIDPEATAPGRPRAPRVPHDARLGRGMAARPRLHAPSRRGAALQATAGPPALRVRPGSFCRARGRRIVFCGSFVRGEGGYASLVDRCARRLVGAGLCTRGSALRARQAAR